MIKTFKRNSNKRWTEVAIADFENNALTTFYYDIFYGKLVKFSEYTHQNFEWNPKTDLTEEIKKEIYTR